MDHLVINKQSSLEAPLFLIKSPFFNDLLGTGKPEVHIWDPDSMDRRDSSEFTYAGDYLHLSCKAVRPMSQKFYNFSNANVCPKMF